MSSDEERKDQRKMNKACVLFPLPLFISPLSFALHHVFFVPLLVWFNSVTMEWNVSVNWIKRNKEGNNNTHLRNEWWIVCFGSFCFFRFILASTHSSFHSFFLPLKWSEREQKTKGHNRKQFITLFSSSCVLFSFSFSWIIMKWREAWIQLKEKRKGTTRKTNEK